jgi:ubiquinone biosynthesis protein UbiJ
MTTLDPGDDHEKIASYYRHEAVTSRQQAEEMVKQAAIYEQLFGRESDWVSGTRLLVQFYEEVAREQDQLADLHLKLSKNRSSN